MARSKQLKILKQGVKTWNQWRKDNLAVDVELNRAYLRGAYLRGANLRRANLREADLQGADLRRVNLSYADLREADLREADLSGADLSGANLSGANLRKADLSGADLSVVNLSCADLSRTDLKEADLTDSFMYYTVLGESDLRTSLGLETITHGGPSTIGTDTIRKSKGKIPAEFLRGCGLSDWEIEAAKLYDPDLSNEEINDIQYRVYDLRATQALQISPLFISYNHADAPFVDKLETLLNAKGIRFWRDIHDMRPGRIEKQVDQAIRHNPTVLLVLSKNSTKSDWVEHEVNLARKLEKETERDILCPVALDDSWQHSAWSQVLMEQVQKYYILDYSCWQEDAEFQRVFVRLVEGLNLYYKKDQ